MKLIRNNDISVRRKVLANVLKEYFGHDDIAKFQADNSLTSDGLFGRNSYEVLYKKILDVTEVPFEDYYQNEFAKGQIILHHSASSDNAKNLFVVWEKDNLGKVATAISIQNNGKVFRGFDERFWANHLYGKNTLFTHGVSSAQSLKLCRESVAVEIANWGFLTRKGTKFFSYANTEIPEQNVLELKFRGQQFFEKYTTEEVLALKKWILLNAIRFEIPLKLDIKEIFDFSRPATQGKKGIWTHCSFRRDKLDIVPQPIMVAMLESLANYEK